MALLSPLVWPGSQQSPLTLFSQGLQLCHSRCCPYNPYQLHGDQHLVLEDPWRGPRQRHGRVWLHAPLPLWGGRRPIARHPSRAPRLQVRRVGQARVLADHHLVRRRHRGGHLRALRVVDRPRRRLARSRGHQAPPMDRMATRSRLVGPQGPRDHPEGWMGHPILPLARRNCTLRMTRIDNCVTMRLNATSS